MILVDSNVLVDVMEGDPMWEPWSIDRLLELSGDDLRVNLVVIAEVAPRTGSLAEFYREMEMLDIRVEQVPDEGAFLAGCAFQAYRRNRGEARTVLPDFLIGGHAQSVGASILTRDPRFYRAYFPNVPLITPEREENG